MKKVWSEIVQNTPMILAFVLGVDLFSRSVGVAVLIIACGMAVGALLIELMMDTRLPLFESIQFSRLVINTAIFSALALPLAWYYSIGIDIPVLVTDTLLGLGAGALVGMLQLPQLEKTSQGQLAHMLSMIVMAVIITNGVRLSMMPADLTQSVLWASGLSAVSSAAIVVSKALILRLPDRGP